MGKKKALLVGCNYPGTKAELRGCINDVKRMHRSLVERFGFAEENITVLIDTDEAYTLPTGANIRAALADLVSYAEDGDVLFFHYSGHGTRLPADAGEDDSTGYDECIVPCDMNLINDEDFRALVDKVPRGCRITIVSDSCHSGGLIEQAKEQIGDSTDGVEGSDAGDSGLVKEWGYSNKSLPLQTLIDILQQKTGQENIGVGQLRPTLFSLFGDDASPTVKNFMKVVLDNFSAGGGGGGGGGGIMGFIGGLAKGYLDNEERVTSHARRGVSDSAVLISGCQTEQTSADANPTGDPADAYGALSNTIQTILAESDGEVSNRELVTKARKILAKQGFTQQPGLYCSDELADAPFIC